MSFIRQGSYIEVKPGHRLAERFGVVRSIKIIEQTSAVLIWADIFNPESGGMDLMMFQPGELMTRRNKPTTAKRTQQHTDEHLLNLSRIAA